ncbi:MAG: NAD-dependent malic enzyme, partial [Proteobacteria bacterium]|nr:NAD-dependent malic enzyme [Pseudomonadota bacterium]
LPVRVGQCNNVFIFPGVGLGVMASGAQEVLPQFFTAAAQAVAEQVPVADLKKGILLPSVSMLREVSLAVALAVGEIAISRGVAKPCVYSAYQHDYKRDRLLRLVEMMGWQPRYLPIVPR